MIKIKSFFIAVFVLGCAMPNQIVATYKRSSVVHGGLAGLVGSGMVAPRVQQFLQQKDYLQKNNWDKMVAHAVGGAVSLGAAACAERDQHAIGGALVAYALRAGGAEYLWSKGRNWWYQDKKKAESATSTVLVPQEPKKEEMIKSAEAPKSDVLAVAATATQNEEAGELESKPSVLQHALTSPVEESNHGY